MEGLLGLRGIVLARLLGPAGFGVWTIFRLGLRYGAFAALGVYRGLEVEVSASGVGTQASSPRLWGRSTAGYLLAVYSAIGLVAVTASPFVGSPIRETLWAIAVGLMVERLWVYGGSYLRAEGRLRRFGLVELVHAAASLILTAVLALIWGLVGAYIGFVAAMLIGISLLGRSVPYRPELSTRRIRTLFDVGIPLSIATIANTLLVTADRIIVAGLEGTETLGLYAFAVAVSSIGASAAWIVRTVVFPDVYAAARSEGGTLAADSHLSETIVPVAYLLPPILGIVALALGPAIAWLAPSYQSVVIVAQIFVFVGVAAGFLSLGTLGVVATERQRALPLIAFGGLVLNSATAVAALLAGWGLAGVAGGALISRSLTGVGIVAVSTGISGPLAATRLAYRLLWPTVWCAGLVLGLGFWRPGVQLIDTAVSTAIYLAALLPLTPHLVRQLRRLSRNPGANLHEPR